MMFGKTLRETNCLRTIWMTFVWTSVNFNLLGNFVEYFLLFVFMHICVQKYKKIRFSGFNLYLIKIVSLSHRKEFLNLLVIW